MGWGVVRWLWGVEGCLGRQTQLGCKWYARGDSNSRTRLRRPVLYPLSYGRVPGDYTDTIGSAATPGLCEWVELVAPLPQCYSISTHVRTK